MGGRRKADVSLAFVFLAARAIISQWCRVCAFMQAVEARRAARRDRVFRDRGNPLDTLYDFIEFHSWCSYIFRREDYLELHNKSSTLPLNLARGEMPQYRQCMNQVILALRYYATGTSLNLDKSMSLWQSNDIFYQTVNLAV